MNETTPVENVTTLPTAKKSNFKRNAIIAGAVTAAVVVIVVTRKKNAQKSLGEEIADVISETVTDIAA